MIAPRLLQQRNEFLDRVGAHNLRALGFVRNKLIYFGDRSIENGDLVAVIVHIQDQVLAHHGQADQSDITCFWLHSIS